MEIFGYTFENPDLLTEALTTPAYRMVKPRARDNQRLEFLGDAVLGLLSAEQVFADFPDSPEGPLTMKRAHMVSSSALCAAAMRLGLRERLLRNAGAEELPPNSKTLADAIEAVLGAAWLDGGMAAARRVFDALALSPNARADDWSDNPKGALQLRSQALTPPEHPVYETIATKGPSHAPTFTVRVRVTGLGEATASAHSRREAEAAAAMALLSTLGGKE